MSIFNTGKPVNKLAKIVPVFLTINNAYAPYAAAAINSLMKHTDPKRFYRVIILHDGLDFISRIRLRNLVTKNCAIQFKKISNSIYLKAIIRYSSKKKGDGDFFSSAVYYYRAFIARLFPQYAKAVYIDSDVILRSDIGELFDLDLEGKAIAAMVDPKVTEVPEFRDYVDKAVGVPHEEYVNSGVMVMDLKKLRKMKYLSTMVRLIDEFNADLVAPDQDYLNIILRGEIKFLDPNWNAAPAQKIGREVKLVHFNLTYKPWHHKNVPSERLFWEAAKGTGFYGDLKRQQENFSKEEQEKEAGKIAALIKKAGEKAKTKKPLVKLMVLLMLMFSSGLNGTVMAVSESEATSSESVESVESETTETATLSESQKAAISENCETIIESLKDVQRADSRMRVYLGKYYELILANFVTPFNVRLVENNLSNAELVENQNELAEKRALFNQDFVEYQQKLEELVAMDCKTEPEKFYEQLEIVRARRKVMAQDVLSMRSLISEHTKLAEAVKGEL